MFPCARRTDDTNVGKIVPAVNFSMHAENLFFFQKGGNNATRKPADVIWEFFSNANYLVYGIGLESVLIDTFLRRDLKKPPVGCYEEMVAIKKCLKRLT